MGLLDDIKKESKRTRTVIQTSEEDQLSKVLNKLFFEEKNIKKEVGFIEHIMTRGLETTERKGLHASAIIKPEKSFCLREQVLSLMYRQLQGQHVETGLKRIFEEGNCIHEKWQRLFIRGGYSEIEQLDKTMFNDEYKISFTPDIICSIPEFYNGQMVGEIKSVNTFQFQKMHHHPSAGKQLQWYMYLTGIHKGFVLNEDKNNQEFKVEVYDYDVHSVAEYIERCEAITYHHEQAINEKKMVMRPSDAKTIDSKRCKQCNMKNVCWGVGKRERLT